MHYFPNFIIGSALYIFRAVPLPVIRSSTTVHSALVHVIQVLKTAFKTSMTCTNAECTVVELLMMGRGTVRNM
jgi:hypothetical protein